MMYLKTAAEIDLIARGGAIIGALVQELSERVRPGVTTLDLDRFCDDFIVSHDGATPAFKGLYGFPGSVCISLNDEIVHGIPSAGRALRGGDIVSVDVGVRLDGWCSDSAWTFAVGTVDADTRTLLEVTEESLYAAIEVATAGNHIGDIGAAVVDRVAGTGLSIVRDLVGHAVGREVHEDPQVPNIGRPGQGAPLREGMVLAIEPMLSLGSDRIKTLSDRWTVVTEDRTAHFEHTVAVMADGPRILTGASDPAGAPTG